MYIAHSVARRKIHNFDCPDLNPFFCFPESPRAGRILDEVADVIIPGVQNVDLHLFQQQGFFEDDTAILPGLSCPGRRTQKKETGIRLRQKRITALTFLLLLNSRIHAPSTA